MEGRSARIRNIAAMAGAVGVLVCVAGLFLAREEFFQAYLYAFVFWVQISLGCLGFLMLHHLVGGDWGRAVRRFLEAGSLNLILLAVLFLPIAFGMEALYPWTHPHEGHEGELLAHKAPYLNVPFYYIRNLFYFAVWAGLAWFLARWSAAEAAAVSGNALDAEKLGKLEQARARLRQLSAPGLILFAFSVNFASYDWTMSLEPEWFSSLYGFLFLAQQAPVTLSLLILAALFTERKGFLTRFLDPSRFRDLGSLLLAFIIIWMYASFFQYMLIWMGNLPEEVTWYQKRNAGAWRYIAWFFTVFYFAVPFLILLFRRNRSSHRGLARLGIWLFLVHLVYLFWFIVPSFHPEGFHIHWLHPAAWAAVGGAWVFVFLLGLRRRPVFDYAEEGAAHG